MKFLKLLTLIIVFSSLNTAFSQINVAATALTTSGDPYPENGMCPVSGRTLQVKIVNNGNSPLDVTSTPVTISVNITGPINQTFSNVINSGTPISPGFSKYVNVTTAADFSLKGGYSIAMSATCTGDQSPGIDQWETFKVEGNKLTITSAPTTSSQTVCLNSSISTITYFVSGNATNATVTGLPPGVTASFTYPNLTITGSPSSLAGSPFSYSVTSSGMCPTSDNETLNGSMIVKSLPTISIVDKTNDTLTCNDPIFVFNAVGGNTYSWSTGATSSNITVSTPGKYILTGTANGCSNKDSVDVKQIITPPNPPVGTDTIRCGPGNFGLKVTSDAKTTVTWYGSNQFTVVGSGLNYTTPSISSTSSYYAEAKNTANGCVSTKTEVKAIVIPFNTAGTPSSIPTVCLNTPLTPITHSTTGATGIASTTINYGLPTGVSASFNASTGVITISGTPTTFLGSPFNYSIPLTGGCGTVSATGTITVNLTNTATGPLTISSCINVPMTSVTQTTTGATGIASTTTNYGLPSGVSASFNASTGVILISGTPSITVGSPFSYNIPLTGGCGSVSASGTLTVNPKPVVSPITGKTFYCVGESATLTSATVGGEWNSSDKTIVTIDKNNGVLTTLKSGSSDITYLVTLNGCSNALTTKVNVNPYPAVSPITGNQVLCLGSNSQLTNSTQGGVWSSSNVALATVNSTGLVNSISLGTATISYSVTSNGCTTTNSTTVTSYENKKLNLKQGVVSENSVDFIWDNINDVAYNYSYKINGSTSSTTGSLPLGSTSYNVKNLNPGDSVYFTLQPNSTSVKCINQESVKGGTIKCIYPNVKLYQVDTTLCLGAKFSFKSEVSNINQKLNYNWFINGTQITNDSSLFVTQSIQKNDKIRVKVIGSNVCENNTEIFTKINDLQLSILVPDMVLANVDSLVLKANPVGGVFSGPGVVNNKLAVKSAGMGSKKINYNYNNPLNNCKGQISKNVMIYDTVFTCKNTIYDTLKVTKYDTITITKNVTKYDTVTVKKDVYDTITITKNVTKYDTVKVKKDVYDTITITKNVTKYDTVTVKKDVFDTITITKNVTKYDTVIVKKDVYDTIVIKNTIYDTVRYTVTDTISILKLKFKLTTGIKAKQETSMRVYPNPTSDILLIEAEDQKALAGFKYKIVDAAGKEVYFKPVVSMLTEISLKSFGAAGTYFFEVFDEKHERVISKKIILE